MSHFNVCGWRTALRMVAALAVLVFATPQCRRAKAPEASTAPVPAGFALIPAGEFMMGDALDRMEDAPQHKVNVSAFFMQNDLVTKAQWDEVRAWGMKHGYDYMLEGKGKTADHPVQTVSWNDVVKWCNAKSEKEGLIPCYYMDAMRTKIYRSGDKSLTNAMVKWSANGYRLPTEAEWEKAARGGLVGKRFPWGDTISHHEANFGNGGRETYQTGTLGYHPTYKTGEKPYTSPAGSFAANGYGLHDMAGNLWEWCWDRQSDYALAPEVDPRGSDSAYDRVIRGGSWLNLAWFTRCAYRDFTGPTCANDFHGFRVARGLP